MPSTTPVRLPFCHVESVGLVQLELQGRYNLDNRRHSLISILLDLLGHVPLALCSTLCMCLLSSLPFLYDTFS
jgi:hypothetical protein